MDQKTVTLGALIVPLKPPTSIASAYDVAAAAGKNPMRGLHAALGLCWGHTKRLKSRFESSYNALEYGGQVFDELVKAGFKPGEINAAAGEALALVTELIVPADEVQASEGNSGAPEDSTST